MTLYKSLGISSAEEAAELEQDLGFRFDDLTPHQRETWKKQTVYLGLYAQTRSFTRAASAAGITVRTVRKWQAQDILGFNDRLELAVLEYTEEIDLMLLQHARKPDCSPSLLMMFARAQVPEKYGPARRDSARPITRCDHENDPQPEASPDDDASHPNLSPHRGETQRGGSPTHTDQPPAGTDSKPAPDLSTHGGETQRESSPTHTDQPPAGTNSKPAPDLSTHGGETQREGWDDGQQPNTQHPEPGPQNLNRRQRRQLQRQQRKQRKHASSPDTRAKQPSSHRPRAPN